MKRRSGAIEALRVMIRLPPLTTPLVTTLMLFALAAYLLPLGDWLPPGTLSPRPGEERSLLDATGFRWPLLVQFVLAPWIASSLPDLLLFLGFLFILRLSEYQLGPPRLLACLWLAQAAMLLLAQLADWPREVDSWIWSPIWGGIAASTSGDLSRQDRPEFLRRCLRQGFNYGLLAAAMWVLIDSRLALHLSASLALSFALGVAVSLTCRRDRLSWPQYRELKRRLLRELLQRHEAGN